MNTPLESSPPYPQALCFVLRMHRSSGQPGQGFKGRLQHLATGTQFEFCDSTGLADAVRETIGKLASPST